MIRENLQKYFNGECSDKEKQSIRDYFINNPRVLSDYFDEDEWEEFQKTYNESTVTLPNNLPRGSAQNIFLITRQRRMRRIVSIAAVFLLMVGIGFSYVLFNSKNSVQVFAKLKSEQSEITPAYISKFNSGNQIVRITLPDGSIVSLSPKSELKYADNFGSKKRDILLEGEAVFEVARDKSKPFTVFSGDLATTALGTKFLVSSFKTKDHIIVELYEGKVVVKPTITNGNAARDYVLMPGNSISFDRIEKEIGLTSTHFNADKELAQTKLTDAASKKTIKLSEKSGDIQFENQPISDVFDYLAEMHGVEIVDSTGRLSAMGFVGKIRKSESVESTLNNIASINGYKVIPDTTNRIFVIK